MKFLRQVAGFLAGYGIFAVSSLAWFAAMHRPSHQAAPLWFMVATAVYGVLFAILAGFVATAIADYTTGFSVGVAVLVVSMLSAMMDTTGAHWSQVIAMVLMAPATVLGAKLRVRRAIQ